MVRHPRQRETDRPAVVPLEGYGEEGPVSLGHAVKGYRILHALQRVKNLVPHVEGVRDAHAAASGGLAHEHAPHHAVDVLQVGR